MKRIIAATIIAVFAFAGVAQAHHGGGDGEPGKDVLTGTSGPDKLVGGHSPDVLIGKAGDDRLWGGRGPDDFHGGPGFDVCHGSAPGAAQTDTYAGCEKIVTDAPVKVFARTSSPGPRWEGGEECRNVYSPVWSNAIARACVLLNTNDQGLFGDVEGMLRIRRIDDRSVDVRIDWIHLYRNGNLVETAGPIEWDRVTAYQVGDWNRYSTSFVNCNTGQGFRAVARFKVRIPGWADSAGEWVKWDSQTLSYSC